MTGGTKGSPPRMRGKPVTRNYREAIVGITPADAGKTSSHALSKSNFQDHPRGCGENPVQAVALNAPVGSPPRMRGKRLLCEPFKAEAGITPADAGKTE